MRLAFLVTGWLISASALPAGAAETPPVLPKSAAPVQPIVSHPAGAGRARGPVAKPSIRDGGKDLGTVDEITIEGEVAVPRVFFITVRDRARFHDPLHRLYLNSSAELARDLRFPLPRVARRHP